MVDGAGCDVRSRWRSLQKTRSAQSGGPACTSRMQLDGAAAPPLPDRPASRQQQCCPAPPAPATQTPPALLLLSPGAMLSAARCARALPELLQAWQAAASAGTPAAALQLQQQAAFAAKAGSKAAKAAPAAAEVVVAKDWKAVQLPEATASTIPTTTLPGQAFVGDLRSTSGLGKGDGKTTHTSKWLEPGLKSPMEYIQSTEPIKVHGAVVASYGSEDPALGCPVEYINLKGTSYDKPAVCKYTGNKYYSDPSDWMAH